MATSSSSSRRNRLTGRCQRRARCYVDEPLPGRSRDSSKRISSTSRGSSERRSSNTRRRSEEAKAVERRAPGDERGAPVGGRGARDEQGRAAVGQRGADHGQSGAEDQDRGAGPHEQRLSELHQFHRCRHDLPRQDAPREVRHGARAGHLQSAADRHRPAAVGHHQQAHLRHVCTTTSVRCSRRLQTIEREVQTPRRALASDSDPAVPDHRRSHRRRSCSHRRTRRAFAGRSSQCGPARSACGC